MRYRQLKAFHSVAVHGGFSRAAAAVHLSQPALSEQVRSLEQDYDILLFRREKRMVELTPAGEQLLILSKRFFDAERQIAGFLSQKSARLEGRLRIMIDSASHITRQLSLFRELYPEVSLTLSSGNSEKMLAALRDYEVEIVVAGDIEPAPDLQLLDLGSSPIVACIKSDLLPASTKAMNLRELAQWPLVFREPGSRTRHRLETAAIEQKLELEPAIEVEGREAMREVLASGAGIGFVSEAEFGNDDRLRPIRIRGTPMRMHENLVYLRQRADLRLIRAFVDTLD